MIVTKKSVAEIAEITDKTKNCASYSEKMHLTFRNIVLITRLGYSRFNKRKRLFPSFFNKRKE